MAITPKSKFLNTAMLCSSSIGIFPSQFLFEDNPFGKLCYSIYSKLSFRLFVLFVLTSYIKLVEIICQNDINFAELSKNLIITPIFTITIIRQISMSTPRLRELLKYILDTERNMDATDDKEVREIDRKCSETCNRNIQIYLGMMVVTELSYTLRPLFEPEEQLFVNNETILVKRLPLSTWFPFDTEHHFIAAYLIQVVYIIFGSCYETYGEFILISLIVYPSGQLKILQHVLRNMDIYQQKLMEQYRCQDKSLMAFVTLRQCIQKHECIIQYVAEFNKVMSTCIFLDFVQSSAHMACILAGALTEQVTTTQIISIAALLIIMNFRLLLYYYYENEVIILSEGLSTAIYESNWYDQCTKVKFMTFMMIMRNHKPLKFKLGAFGYMSLNTFLSILNAAYSYVMLMCSLK